MIHKAKKSLGQNFLKSEMALRKIVEAGELDPGDIILEIGPGKGALTEKLLEKSRQVIAVEKDRELLEFLETKFEKEIKQRSLVLVHGDILEFDIKETLENLFGDISLKSKVGQSFLNGLPQGGTRENRGPEKGSAPRSYKIIANIPYNITGAILKKFLGGPDQPKKMVLMVQNEVGKRIMARDGKESLLSISVKAYGEPKMIMKVPARYFSPAPKVDSAIIAIKNISRKMFEENKIDEEKFWEIVKAGFAHKRKKLSSNLKSLVKNGSLASTSLENLGNKRAEELSLDEWVALAK